MQVPVKIYVLRVQLDSLVMYFHQFVSYEISLRFSLVEIILQDYEQETINNKKSCLNNRNFLEARNRKLIMAKLKHNLF